MLSRILGAVAGIAAAGFVMVGAGFAAPMPDDIMMIARTVDMQRSLSGDALTATIVSLPAALLLFGSALTVIGLIDCRRQNPCRMV